MLSNLSRSLVPTRRGLLKAGLAAGACTGAGLILGVNLTCGPAVGQTAKGFRANAFVRIGTDDTVTVIAKHLEMGQGIYTGLATILAEELDAAWAQVRVESAPADATLYNNLNFGPMQGTGGSSSVANSFQQLRQAGAAARAMLVAAAAARWKVPAGEISVEAGIVQHAQSGRTARFGELAEAAAKQPVPSAIRLKDPKDFTLVGTTLPRVDSVAKTTGTARFAMDIRLSGMLTAVVARPPQFGATVKSFDAAKAKAVAGVRHVVKIPSGIAVVAENTWAAMKGRELLAIEWDDSKAEKRGTAELLTEYRALADRPGAVAKKRGDVEGAFGGAAKILEARFDFPYLAHAPMEPLDCVVLLTPTSCEIWAGDQFQTVDQMNAAAALGLKPAQVKINTTLAGGSFGRRANAASDYIVEGVQIARAIKGVAPVRLVWTREDDIRGGKYRPLYHHRMKAAIGGDGMPVAWQHRIVGQSILGATPFAAMVKGGIDSTSVEGATNLPYAIPNFQVELHTTEVGVPVLWWRSVGSTHTAFSTEVMIDEMARAAGKDPVAYRLSLLTEHLRHRRALTLAAKMADWSAPLPPGRFRGVALHESFRSYVAEIAEVSVAADGAFKVERVVCAVDCGIAINPDVIRAQMEGGIGYGLSAALGEAVTLEGGRVVQSNFHDYAPLRITDMPRVEVHIVKSGAAPTGVGEPGVPPIGPAVANALAAATRKGIRSLPLRVS
ncbi:MAG: xanthine dehydrogenase family protein molybdopterin-binding subunit [Rhodospirillaceae bacterium]|nr:xanthine dehydrogenase family protein molybdopterin-binding subunit [Rhodospirillaceae bacterium]